MDPRRLLGNRGERQAERFLKRQGYRVLARQYRTRFGEIDLVCLAPQADEIVFVEVKTRESLGGGYPEESVTPEKLQHLAAAADLYLQETRQELRPYRFDLIAILDVPGKDPEIRHVCGL